jgi:hypothetical protein
VVQSALDDFRWQGLAFAMRYLVHEPYRSMVMRHPLQASFILECLSRSRSDGDEEQLELLLSQDVPSVVSEGIL